MMKKVLLTICILNVALNVSACKTMRDFTQKFVNDTLQSAEETETSQVRIVESEPIETIVETEIVETEVTMEDLETYIFPQSDKQLLGTADLDGISPEMLRIGRNEIYARHGRKFSTDDLKEYFEAQKWYSGTIEPGDFSEDLLNEIEKENVRIIQAAEAYKEDTSASSNTYGYAYIIYSTGEKIAKEFPDYIELTIKANDSVTGIYHGSSVGNEWSEMQGEELLFVASTSGYWNVILATDPDFDTVSSKCYDCTKVLDYEMSITITDDTLYVCEDGADCFWVYKKKDEIGRTIEWNGADGASAMKK